MAFINQLIPRHNTSHHLPVLNRRSSKAAAVRIHKPVTITTVCIGEGDLPAPVVLTSKSTSAAAAAAASKKGGTKGQTKASPANQAAVNAAIAAVAQAFRDQDKKGDGNVSGK
jgi:hypothetical protein